ncbi:MAG: glycosyltransferase family 39 protein [Thermomicrobiales bacterium]
MTSSPLPRQTESLTPPAASARRRFARLAIPEAIAHERAVLVLLLAIYLVKGLWLVDFHPPFSGHDEVAHYAYISTLVTEGRIPRIPDPDMWATPGTVADPDDFDRISSYFWGYCRYSTQDWSGCGDNQCPDSCYFHIDPATGIIMPAGWIYTANHPPLYYLLMVPIFWATENHWPEDQLPWFRRAAIPFGMATVLLSYLIVRQLFPGRCDASRFLALTVPAIIAFQPQVSYEAAMLNNDIMAIALTSTVIWLITIGIRRGFRIRTSVLIGFVLGLALLTKTTAITVTPAIAVAMVLTCGWRTWRGRHGWMTHGAIAAGVAALTCWPWYAYMWQRYGDFNALDRIQRLQWWNYQNETPPTVLSQLTDRDFFWRILEQSFGGFGWHLIPFSDTLKAVLAALFIAGIAGLSCFTIRVYLGTPPRGHLEGWRTTGWTRRLAIGGVDRRQVVGLATMGTMVVVSYAALLQFGVEFQGTQARYAFPAVIPAAILLMTGLRGWVPQRWLRWLPVVVIVGVIFLNVWIYWRYVLPWIDSRS